MPPSRFQSLPGEVLEDITLLLVQISFLGPPADILTVPLLSKDIWERISIPHICAKIFTLKFDVCAAIRRLGRGSAYVRVLSAELVKRFSTLKRLKSGDYSLPNEREAFRIDLWTAYLLFLEDDGKNSRQLIEYAKVDQFVSNFLRGPLDNSANTVGGWAVDNEQNALVIWLFWYTDKDRSRHETRVQRRKTLHTLAQFFLGSFKYPSTHAPITSFKIPPATPPQSHTRLPVISLVTSPVSSTCVIQDHFGSELVLAQPLIVPPALMSSIVRFEAINAETVELFSQSQIPATPTERGGPAALMDWTELGGDPGGIGSERHEHDWTRVLTCYDPWSRPGRPGHAFTPGMLHGTWCGRWFITPPDEFESAIPTEQRPPAASMIWPLILQVPWHLQLWEHHQHDETDVVDFDDISRDQTGQGVLNAWLPEGTTMVRTEEDLRIYAPGAARPSTYRTHKPGHQISHEGLVEDQGAFGGGILDVILTGKVNSPQRTDVKFYGRVREWDGLVILVYVICGVRRWIFYGYLHGNQILVGRWRETLTPVHRVGWTGVWYMTRE